MFKVECLGCQAPYQVDEKRVPEKGLKMRCPKCGTSFKVEPPAKLGASSSAASAPPPAVKPAPITAAPAFASAALDPGAKVGKPPAAREGLARTMIGVSAGDLDLLKGPATAPQPPPRAGFRIPRPRPDSAMINAVTDDRAAADVPAASPTEAVIEEVIEETAHTPSASPPEADVDTSREPYAATLGFSRSTAGVEEDAGLPEVLGAAALRQGAAIAAKAGPVNSWLPAETLSDAPPESLAEPSNPLSLSELPQPIPGGARAPDPAPQAKKGGSALELDFGDELPAVAAAPRRAAPPPRRARPGTLDAKPPPAEAPDTLDLPARIEDLGPGLPKLAPAPQRAAPALEERPRTKPSSLDELDLPAIAAREARFEPVATPEAAFDEVDLPSAQHVPDRPRELSHADLPAVGRGRLQRDPDPVEQAPRFSDLPDVLGAGQPQSSLGNVPQRVHSDLPDVLGGGLPDVARAGLPAVARAGLPAVAKAGLPAVVSAGLPEVAGSGLPAVVAAGLPEISGAGLPEVLAAGLPVVGGAGLPEVLRAGLPEVSPSGLPEIAGRGVRGFGRVDLPVAREAGLPDVRPLEMDLPGVGESLPAVAEFGEANLPTVGESLPATKARGSRSVFGEGFDDDASPFGGDADGDPFGVSEAELGSGSDGAAAGEAWGPNAGEGAARRSGEPTGYGEVEIGGGGGVDAPLETADDMEFSAIPDKASRTSGRAAATASAAVHDGSDAEANGSTLELGQDRRTFVRTRSKSRRLVVASVLCAAIVAGGALALEPALGPFGVNFILDQVKRGQREQVLAKLVDEERRAIARDTFQPMEQVLGSFDAARQEAPRFAPLQARAAFANFDAVLRFGPLPKLEAAGKAALALLDTESSATSHRLARAAQAAALRSPDAKGQLEALGNDPDARQLLGELALAMGDYAGAVSIWSELMKQWPDSARAAYCFGAAQLGLGKTDAAIAAAERASSLNPEHVGAHILRLEAHRAAARASAKGRTENFDSEALSAAVQRVLPRASPGEAALAHSVLGELHASQGRSGPAQHAFEEALAIDRNFPRALIGLGETLHEAGRHTEALARFESAARAEPGSLAAELGIAKSQILLAKLPEAKAVLTRLQGKHKDRPEVIFWMAKAEQAVGSIDAALAGYRAAIEAGKGRADSVDAYLALAKLQADLGQLVEAQKTLSEADDKLPPSGELHKALGEIASNRAQYGDAYAHFQKAEQLDPGDTRARFLGAVALTRLGRFDEALAAFQRVSETDKDFPGLATERGRLYEESGKNQEALKEYEAAFKQSPDDMDLQIRLGCSRVVAGHAAEAEALLEKVAKALPRSAEAYHCLGRAMFEQERHGDAIVRLERAVALDASRAVYSLYQGWALAEVGRHGDAEAAFERALELDKGLADAYWQRGRLRLKQGAVKDAIRDLEHSLELKPSRHEARADLAVAYADLGRLPQALKAWEDALARDADNATWHFRYGKLLSSSGNGAQAAAHLRRAVDLVSEAQASTPLAQRPKPPIWLWQAHYLLGRELGMIPAAIAHWQAYLRLSPADDPYRPEAERALQALGQPWEKH